MQWHAIAIVLGKLVEQPPSSVTERAWNVIDAIKWDEPEDRASRNLSQSVKRLHSKAQAHKRAQTNPSQPIVLQAEQPGSPAVEQYSSEGPFFTVLTGQNYHGPINFVDMEDHHPAPFYMGQHTSPHDAGPQQPVANWYFDSTAVQPLQEPDPMVFNTEVWRGWDMVRDDLMHRGPG